MSSNSNSSFSNETEPPPAPAPLCRPFVHSRVCDECKTFPIVGLRYHALNRDDDFDLCKACKERYDENTHLKTAHGNSSTEMVLEEIAETDVDREQQDELWQYLENASPFQRWLDAHNGKTTLQEQVRLARHIYDEAMEHHNVAVVPRPSVEESIRTLQEETPIDTNHIVSWQGIELEWFCRTFCQTPFWKRLQDFGCELWFVRKVCVIELIAQCRAMATNAADNYSSSNNETDHRTEVLSGPFIEHIQDEWVRKRVECRSNDEALATHTTQEKPPPPIVSKPTTFISYTGRYTLRYLVEVLTQQLEENSNDGEKKDTAKTEYIWMDIFCVDQFAWTGKGRSSEMKEFREGFMDDLQQQIQQIQRTALVLEHWDMVMATLEQIWVLWEIFNTAEADVELVVLLPPEEMQHYLVTSLETAPKDGKAFDSFQSCLSSIDVKQLQAQDDLDRTLIFDRMLERGLDKVNTMVIAKMRSWLVDVASAHLVKLRELEGPDNVNPIFLHGFAMLLKEHGQLQESEVLHREALERARQVWGEDHPNTLTCLSDVAYLLQIRGAWDESEQLTRQALHAQIARLGFEDIGTIQSLNGLACFQHERGRLEEAEETFVLSLKHARNHLGDDHPVTLSILRNFGWLLRAQRRVNDAEPLLRLALEGKRKLLGDRHPETLGLMAIVASLLRLQNKLDEAEPLLRLALEGKRQQLGSQNPSTLETAGGLVSLLGAQRQYPEAESLGLEVVEGLRQELGSDCPPTLRAVNNLALLYKQMGQLDRAESLYREALEGQIRCSGETHPDTLTSMFNLALTCERQPGGRKEAEELLKRALNGSQSTLGKDHPDTIQIQEALDDLQSHCTVS